MNNLDRQFANDGHPAKESRLNVGILLCSCVVIVLLGGIPFLFLLYGAIGTGLLGVSILATLISIQFLLFYPLWNSLNREADRSSNRDAGRNSRGD
ncbi:hypothetical protein AB1L42_14180 [Thalassoglobus sp. JC818]|uniref:hypothetical protein n=1 Tax=Thalassoglobus sp. JC818 TaxID=3232136 RepID=UPI00345B0989